MYYVKKIAYIQADQIETSFLPVKRTTKLKNSQKA